MCLAAQRFPGLRTLNAVDTTERDALHARSFFSVLGRRRLLFLSIFAVVVGTAVITTLSTPPTYRATSKIVVGQGNSLFQPGQAGAVQPFTATMSDLIKSTVVAQQVIEDLGLLETPDELLSRVGVSFNPDTAVLNLSVEGNDRDEVVRIANSFGESFSSLVRFRFGATDVSTTDPNEQPPLTATVWDPAYATVDPIRPRPVRDIAIAIMLALVFATVVAFLREHLDRALRTREEVEKTLGAPVIGQIPLTRRPQRQPPLALADQLRDAAEAYRTLRTNLQYLGVRRPLKTILVSSASPGQGKTTVTANLAFAIASSGANTLVIDGDLRRPQLQHALRVEGQHPGLTNVLLGTVSLERAVIGLSLPSTNGQRDAAAGRIGLLPSGPIPPNPSELLSTDGMRRTIEEAGAGWEYVLIDSPPLLVVSDALELARIVDGVMLVTRQGQLSGEEAREVRQLVERLEMNLLGVVMTGTTQPTAYYYGHDEGSTPPPPGRPARPSVVIQTPQLAEEKPRQRAQRPAR